ncbi:isopentenyl-diphosphate delta-isomerase [Paenibacillus konkukensis]|uniref:Isopentenyl-diphosphate delta-isomerase n=1 Tax=Paenibacillus konkukensis TaxID=2020716 RepID=A0ABY4RZ98_9BACL|nr:NUDIX domain-containing protein [Paenibacillus konkukensis]UQZ87452.1 isopentenyl-diphosphate delta-isomerase [Paenibacillus konkukensis]
MAKQEQERFDIFDETMKPIGTATRKEVHAKGLWHQTFHCWIVTRTGEETRILFQMRHPDKDTYPNLLDISCAGHLMAGERVEDGVRELEEELGVVASFERLKSCGVYREERIIAADTIDREWYHVFMLASDQPLASYRLQEDEVTGLYSIPLSCVGDLARGRSDFEIRAAGVEPDESGKLQAVERTFRKRDFVPHEPGYFELVLREAQRL